MELTFSVVEILHKVPIYQYVQKGALFCLVFESFAKIKSYLVSTHLQKAGFK